MQKYSINIYYFTRICRYLYLKTEKPAYEGMAFIEKRIIFPKACQVQFVYTTISKKNMDVFLETV